MNINYGDIITKAAERKDALQQIDHIITNQAGGALAALDCLIEFLKSLDDEGRRLDSEGRGLLPVAVQNTINRGFISYLKSLRSSAGGDSGIHPLAALARGEE